MSKLDKKRGTSFRGYLYARYDQLVAAFGIPPESRSIDNKVDVEWIIDTPYGVATIYNYKDGRAYLGESGLMPEQIYEWHIGGKKNEAYDWVKKLLYRNITTRS